MYRSVIGCFERQVHLGENVSGHIHSEAFLARCTCLSKPPMTNLLILSGSKGSLNEQNFQMLKVGKFCLSSSNRLGDIALEVRGGFSGYPLFGAFLPRCSYLPKPSITDLFMQSGSKVS